jgi:hypothetical protein
VGGWTITSEQDGRTAIEALPEIIRIGGFDISIQKWNHHQVLGTQRWGEFSSNEQTLRIRLDMPTKFKAVDTLLHEVMHAVFWAYGVEDEDKEERIVASLGSAQVALYRDNPWLLKWIGEALA